MKTVKVLVPVEIRVNDENDEDEVIAELRDKLQEAIDDDMLADYKIDEVEDD